MRRAVRIVKGIVRGLLIVIVCLFAFYNVYMLIARYAFHDRMPTFFGLAFAVVATGSMEPEIAAGDVIVTKAQEGYEAGDIITYLDEARGEYVTHRIVRTEGGNYITKGDANNAEDAPVAASAVVGKVISVWRGVGDVIGFLQSPLGLLAVFGAGVLIWLATDLLTGTFGRKDEQERSEKQD